MGTLAFQDAGLKCSFHLIYPVKVFWQQPDRSPVPAIKKVAYCSENHTLIQCAFREYSQAARLPFVSCWRVGSVRVICSVLLSSGELVQGEYLSLFAQGAHNFPKRYAQDIHRNIVHIEISSHWSKNTRLLRNYMNYNNIKI